MNTDGARTQLHRIPKQSSWQGAGLSLTLTNASCAVGIDQTAHGRRRKGRIESLAVFVETIDRAAQGGSEDHTSPPNCITPLQQNRQKQAHSLQSRQFFAGRRLQHDASRTPGDCMPKEDYGP
jgi:hypothetical protein